MKGQCLCGATQFDVQLKSHALTCCHCSICRRQSSGVLMNVAVDLNQLSWLQQMHLKTYASSDWGERGFCGQCGTQLFWRSQELNLCHFNPFVFDPPLTDLSFSEEIFVDQQPPFYSFQQDTQRLTEEQVIAKYQPEAD